MAREKDQVDDAIGRPGPWDTRRYQSDRQSGKQSVLTPPGSSPYPEGPASTPVTRKDYLLPGEDAREDADDVPPGGDAG